MKISFEKLKKISEMPWFYPMALFLMAVVTYGYELTSLGYYWSDWEVVFYTKLAPALQAGFYADDRPYPWDYSLKFLWLVRMPGGGIWCS